MSTKNKLVVEGGNEGGIGTQRKYSERLGLFGQRFFREWRDMASGTTWMKPVVEDVATISYLRDELRNIKKEK